MKIWNKIKSNKLMHVLKIVSENASFALFVSIIFFSIEMFRNMEDSQGMTENMLKIQNSLTTKYLGNFPDFLPDIDRLYSEVIKGDSIVVLEDVLFYGINSAPKDFYETTAKLLNLAANRVPITIAYYEPNSFAYNLTIQEWMLSPTCYKNYRDTLYLLHQRNQMFKQKLKKIYTDTNLNDNQLHKEKLTLLKDCFGDIIGEEALEVQSRYIVENKETQPLIEEGTRKNHNNNERFRTFLLEKYFAATRENDIDAFSKMIESYRKRTLYNIDIVPSTQAEYETQHMTKRMDSIRLKYLDKPIESIKYEDFTNMFSDMTQEIKNVYSKYETIKLIPIDDFLSVRGWLVCSPKNGDKAIIAFPSRYSSSEIGFYTTDESTSEYIRTMQKGILINYK